jgi:hypothetical protein
MTPTQFKEAWKPDNIMRWAEIDLSELNKAPLTDLTKDFLKGGFPEDAAPFLNFGLRGSEGKFENVAECYQRHGNEGVTKNYWVFGSDGEGNPLCFDTTQNDRIIWLDHEQNFEIIGIVNANVMELAECLLAYRNFVQRMFLKNGEDALDSDISAEQFSDLVNKFKAINPNIFKESGFWRSEVNALKPK